MKASNEAAQLHTEDWQSLVSIEELGLNGRLMKRVSGRQIAVFQTGNGPLACANQCPHEGYPLSEGSLDGNCILTCNWHNWKFDLSTGTNLYGGDRLRTYRLQERDGQLWIDLADPPNAHRRATTLVSLRDAFDDNTYDRMARELARYIRFDGDPLEPLRQAIHWSWERMEFGWTHAYAGVADWLQLFSEHHDDVQLRLVCLLESIAHIAFDVMREPKYPYGEGSSPWHEAEFIAAIEREDELAAVSMLRGGLADGLGFADFEQGLTRAALAHYNDFGHSLIYVCKAGQLISRLGIEVAEPLLCSLVREMVFATREDLIPEFRGYSKAQESWREQLPGDSAPAMEDWRKKGIKSSLDLVLQHAGAPVEALYHALLGANALNLLAFDAQGQDRVDVPVSANVGWLDFTHGITFAVAVRCQCEKFPELWPQGLLQMALFNGRNASFTLPDADLSAWQVAATDTFIDQAVLDLFDHGQGEFIISVHLLKTTLAVRAELAAGLSDELAKVLTASLNRFSNSPLKRRQLRRTASQAMQFVAGE